MVKLNLPIFSQGIPIYTVEEGTAPCILDGMEMLSGSVERITYYNPENGYTVLRLRPEYTQGIHAAPKSSLSFDGLATVVGNLPEVSPGERLRLQRQWDRHSKHGVQFKAEVCEQTQPATIAGIQGYLGSGMIKGIGSKLANESLDGSRRTRSM